MEASGQDTTLAGLRSSVRISPPFASVVVQTPTVRVSASPLTTLCAGLCLAQVSPLCEGLLPHLPLQVCLSFPSWCVQMLVHLHLQVSVPLSPTPSGYVCALTCATRFPISLLSCFPNGDVSISLPSPDVCACSPLPSHTPGYLCLQIPRCACVSHHHCVCIFLPSRCV